MTLSSSERAHFSKWNKRISRHARRIRILGPLSWPPEVEAAFFAARAAGATALPDPPSPQLDHDDERRALEAAQKAVDGSHPIGRFLRRTAQSYLDAADMLSAAGSPAFTARSTRLYGHPREPIAPGAPTHLEAARQFLAASEGCPTFPQDSGLPAEEAADWLRQRIGPYFPETLPVELDPNLASLATAGARRVRLRSGVRYSERTLEQLFQHEALVHSATKRNGRAQPLLTCLGLSAPRTTTVQEGLATLAEMITDTMDLHRLRRIALRIIAIDAALEGGDFLEVFHLFVQHGQSEREAFRSSARVFRGGDVHGGIAFTKDVVYLKGLMRTHTFLLKAVQGGHRQLPARLFAGRMALSDALSLAPFFESGDIIAPVTLPDWVRNLPCLSAYLTWAAFSNRIPLSTLSLDDFRREDD